MPVGDRQFYTASGKKANLQIRVWNVSCDNSDQFKKLVLSIQANSAIWTKIYKMVSNIHTIC